MNFVEKIKINTAGKLELWRKNTWVSQICIYKDKWCSHNCPAFNEPYSWPEEEGLICVEICNNVLYCKTEDFIDER